MSLKLMSASDYPWDAVWPKVYFALLTISSLVSWFRQFADLMIESDRRDIKDRDYLGFTVLKQTKSEDYPVVQGIFAQKDSKVYDARVIEASSIDSQILKAHDSGKKELVFWS